MATALVVDDSRSMRMILSGALKKLGFEVREAANGKEALLMAEAGKGIITLALVDWNMPEMDGLELVKLLRENPEFSSVVIVMVTAETEMSRIAEALNAGADEYVMKPFTNEILVDKLELTGIHPCGA